MEQKALLIIKTCAETYNDGRSYPIFKQTYDKLVSDGLRFPEFDQNESNIIFAPESRSSADTKADKPEEVLEDENEDLPVLKTPEKIEGVTNPSLVQSQEMCLLLHQMILSNQDLKTNELVQSVVQQLRVSKNEIMAILNSTNNEKDIASALAVNDLVVQTLFGYEQVSNGLMRREAPEKEGEASEIDDAASPLFPDLKVDAAEAEEEVEGASEPGSKKKKKKKKKKKSADDFALSPPAAVGRKKSGADQAASEPGLLDDLLFSPPKQTDGKDPFENFANQFVKKAEPTNPDPFGSAAPQISEDPFSATKDPFVSKPADPFATSDPFSPPQPTRQPFQTSPNPFDQPKDPFTNKDPFTQDPFSSKANDPFSSSNPFQANDKRDPFKKMDPFSTPSGASNIFTQPATSGFSNQPVNTGFSNNNMFTQPAFPNPPMNSGISNQPNVGFMTSPPQNNFFNMPANNGFAPQNPSYQPNPFPIQQQNQPIPQPDFFQQPYQPPPDPFASIPNNMPGTQPSSSQQFKPMRKKLTKSHDPFKDVDPFASM